VIPEIHSYLQEPNPDFLSGFGLFCKYSRNENLMRAISKRRDMETLLYQLQKIDTLSPEPVRESAHTNFTRFSQQTPTPVPAVKPSPEPETQRITFIQDEKPVFRTYDDRKTRRADLSPEFQEVYDRISEDSKIRRAYHEKMKMAKTDADRANFRAKILQTHDMIQDGWRKIDDYLIEKAKNEAFTEFKESTVRAFISKMLKKEQLTPSQAESVRVRVKALQEHGCTISEKTLEALRKRNLLPQ